MTSVDGWNVKPARDLTEAEMRTRMAELYQQRAETCSLMARLYPHNREFYEKNALEHADHARALRQGAPR